MIDKMLRSIIEQDRASVVVCDLNHMICYMNPASIVRYAKYGGNLVGKSLMDCHNERSCEIITRVVEWFAADKGNNMIYTYHNEKNNIDEYMVALRDENSELIGYYEKHEHRDAETAERYDFSRSLV